MGARCEQKVRLLDFARNNRVREGSSGHYLTSTTVQPLSTLFKRKVMSPVCGWGLPLVGVNISENVPFTVALPSGWILGVPAWTLILMALELPKAVSMARLVLAGEVGQTDQRALASRRL
jgi:hypothetical protein